MNDTDLLANAPAWLKYLGTAVGSAGIAGLTLRQWLSKASVERASDDAEINVIKTLQAERDAALKRADEAQAQLLAAVQEMGSLRAEIAGLRMQVESLTEQVHNLKTAGGSK